MNKHRTLPITRLLAAFALGICPAIADSPKTIPDHTEGARKQPARLAINKGDKIVFMGDSITEAGHRTENGYVNMVMRALNQEGLELTHVGAGVSGQKSNDMLARVDADVIGNKPQWLLLSCGVNDVWHFKLRLGRQTFVGVPLDEYKKNITSIIDKAQAANIKVMMAKGVLKAFGLSDDKIAAAGKSWLEEGKPAAAGQ